MYNRKYKIIFPRLERLMNEQGFSAHELAKAINMDVHTLLNRLYGRTEFKLWEAIAIKKELKSGLTLEELFDMAERGKTMEVEE